MDSYKYNNNNSSAGGAMRENITPINKIDFIRPMAFSVEEPENQISLTNNKEQDKRQKTVEY